MHRRHGIWSSAVSPAKSGFQMRCDHKCRGMERCKQVRPSPPDVVTSSCVMQLSSVPKAQWVLGGLVDTVALALVAIRT